MLWKWSESEGRSIVSDSLRPHGIYSPWNSPGQNTGVGSLSLLQGIFLIQGLNPGFLHCRRILYQLSHKGSPKIDVIISHILAWIWMSYLCAKRYNLKSKYCSLQVSGIKTNKQNKTKQNTQNCLLFICKRDWMSYCEQEGWASQDAKTSCIDNGPILERRDQTENIMIYCL